MGAKTYCTLKNPQTNGGGNMAKNKNNQSMKNNKALAKTNSEFAGENGLEKIVIRSQKKSK
jgi:hypothetical protein